MIRLIFKFCAFCVFCVTFAACEKPIEKEKGDDVVVLKFQPTIKDAETRAAMSNYFSKLNVQIFNADGEKMFERVKTQTKEDADFGVLELKLTAGTYTVVAVGHSSKNSATIKSPEVVQFTASNGEKLTDTFCHCSQIVVGGDEVEFSLTMYRIGAMIQFCLQDDDMPVNFSHFKMEYTGGSANFNPTTLEGITKSSQSEMRTTNGIQIYQAFTFPYLSSSGYIKMTCTALDVDGNIIRQREFPSIPVTRNRITTFTGSFFVDGDGVFTQSDFGFVVHADWDGEDFYTY